MNRKSFLRLSVLLACSCGPDDNPWAFGGPDHDGGRDASATDGGSSPQDGGDEEPGDAAQPADSGEGLDSGREDPLDGSVADASVADAGETTLDAGRDAGGSNPPDGSLVDGGDGRDDASVPDSGLDAGEPDAGELDAGEPDSGEPVSDGGVVGCVAPDGGVAASEPADIVMVLDTSGSMTEEICSVGANLQTFVQRAGADVRLVTVYEMDLLSLAALQLCGSMDPIGTSPLTEDEERYLHVPTIVDSVSSLTVLLGSFGSYEDFLRPGVATHFVAITDDESALSANEFAAQMEELLGHSFTFHAVVADGTNGCMGAAVGAQYLALVEQTGGQHFSVCAPDWGSELATLGCAIAAP